MNDHTMRAIRTRWAAIGAAVAVAIGGGGIAITNAAVSTGTRSVFIPIAPCRLLDTRPAPDTVGPRTAPLGPGETFTLQVTGANGNCTAEPIPPDATAVAMNVTAVAGDAPSFLKIYPADLAVAPSVSSLNWGPGSAAAPNKVDVKLSPVGQINLFNANGTVHVLADVVGYYTDHNHDDRYFTEAETYAKTEVYNKTEDDARFTTKSEVAAAPYSHLVAGGWVSSGGVLGYSFGNIETANYATGAYRITLLGYNPGCGSAPAPFPTATLVDTSGFISISGSVSTSCLSGDTSVFVFTRNTANAAANSNFTFSLFVDT